MYMYEERDIWCLFTGCDSNFATPQPQIPSEQARSFRASNSLDQDTSLQIAEFAAGLQTLSKKSSARAPSSKSLAQ